MALLLGPNTLSNVTLPFAVDANKLRELALRDGTTFDAVFTDINDALVIAWSRVKSNPLFQSIVHITTTPEVEYRVGTTSGFQEKTELGRPDASRTDTSGHMLPLKGYDRALEWSEDYLKVVRMIKIEGDIAAVVEDLERLIWKMLFTRLFSKEALSGKSFGLGATGKSVPFCDGGACGVPFTPISRPDRAFEGASTHDHYLRLEGKTQANVEAAVRHLWEHGHDGPYDMIVAEADAGDWKNKTNVTGFKEKAPSLATTRSDESYANVDESYLGVITTEKGPVRLRATGYVQSDWWNVHKSFGNNDRRNPLRMRYDAIHGEGPVLKVETVKTLPLEGAIVEIHFGFGVGEDLTSAVNVKDSNAGAYSNPVIAG